MIVNMFSRYNITNPVGRLYLLCLDIIINVCIKPWRNKKQIPIKPEKILISNGAHLGDLVLSTTVAYWLKKRFPDAKIGCLCGSWSKVVAEQHPAIDFVHCVDHWKLNRQKKNIMKKLIQFFKTCNQARVEINAIKYDCSIDTYYYYPNMSIFLATTNILYKIGNEYGGCGDLLDYNFTRIWPLKKQYLEYLTDALDKLNFLPKQWEFSNQLVSNQFKELNKQYICIHPNSENKRFNWPIEKWQFVISFAEKMGYQVVVTGKGQRDLEISKELSKENPNIVNRVNELNWEAFVSIVCNASAVVSVETVTGHIAALNQVPLVSLYFGDSNINFWKPQGKEVTVFAPLNEISPEIVTERLMKYLR